MDLILCGMNLVLNVLDGRNIPMIPSKIDMSIMKLENDIRTFESLEATLIRLKKESAFLIDLAKEIENCKNVVKKLKEIK